MAGGRAKLAARPNEKTKTYDAIAEKASKKKNGNQIYAETICRPIYGRFYKLACDEFSAIVP